MNSLTYYCQFMFSLIISYKKNIFEKYYLYGSVCPLYYKYVTVKV